MALKQVAIVPHPLILIPNIGKGNINRLEQTINIYKKIEKKFIEEGIETIIIISSHGPQTEDIFTINMSKQFEINFEDIGDFSTKFKVSSDIELSQNIRNHLINNENVQLTNQTVLDHGASVPIYYLCQGELKNTEIIPIYTCSLNIKEHFKIGQQIKEIINKSKKKIAVIASGDLSHCVNENSLAGYSPRGTKFDQRLISYLQEKEAKKILQFDEEIIKEAKPCGLKAITTLIGIIDDSKYEIESQYYEAPFGVGHFTAQININKR